MSFDEFGKRTADPREAHIKHVAALLDPWNWARLGFAVSVWVLHRAGRPFTRRVG